MQHYYSLQEVSLPDSWLTIGSFDGVHRGHQAILKQLVEGSHAVGLPAVVLTFFPHPSVVLRDRKEAFYLTSPEERASLLSKAGIDVIVTHPFTRELAALSAQEFMAIVQKHLRPSHLWVGYDFALGRGREGNTEKLRQLGNEFHYSLNIIRPFQYEGKTISSSQIRKSLSEGDVWKVMQMLGRPYNLSGKIIHGDGRGKLIGIPTANLEIWPWRALPKAGVYACYAIIEGQSWQAATNVGVNPTFDNGPVAPRVETHIIDFDQNLYGRTVQLEFISRMRDEQRFPNVKALVEQIQHDIHQARQELQGTEEDFSYAAISGPGKAHS